MQGNIFLVSGPSGCGKSTLLKRLMDEFDNVVFSISSTTRLPRPGEVDGVNYHFITDSKFKNGIKNGEFLEWAHVHNHYYGTSIKQCENAIRLGKTIIFDVDVQGYRIVKSKLNDLLTSVFITTKNGKQLENRLCSRNTDSDKSLKLRLDNSFTEMKDIKFYDFLIFNDDLDDCYKQLKSIFIASLCKTKLYDLENIIKTWNNF